MRIGHEPRRSLERPRKLFGTPLGWALLAGVGAVVAAVGLIMAVTSWREDGGSAVVALTPGEAAAAAGETSARLAIRVEYKSFDGREIDARIVGVADFEHDAFAMDFEDGRRQILKDGVLYTWEPDRGMWRRYTTNTDNTGEISGQHWLELIAGAEDVEFVGFEALAGAQAGHYRFTAPHPLRASLRQEVVDMYRDSPRLLDVWVADGRPVKAIQRIEKRNTGNPEQDGELSMITIEWSDWGRKVDIRAPDPADIED